MNTAEQISLLNIRLAQLCSDVVRINKETDDLATRIWTDTAISWLERVSGSINNAQVAAEKAEAEE